MDMLDPIMTGIVVLSAVLGWLAAMWLLDEPHQRALRDAYRAGFRDGERTAREAMEAETAFYRAFRPLTPPRENGDRT